VVEPLTLLSILDGNPLGPIPSGTFFGTPHVTSMYAASRRDEVLTIYSSLQGLSDVVIEANAFQGLAATTMYATHGRTPEVTLVSNLFGSYIFSLSSEAFAPGLETFMFVLVSYGRS
jgi:hypothetical protein